MPNPFKGRREPAPVSVHHEGWMISGQKTVFCWDNLIQVCGGKLSFVVFYNGIFIVYLLVVNYLGGRSLLFICNCKLSLDFWESLFRILICSEVVLSGW